MSSALTPRASRFSSEVNEKPVMASMSPLGQHGLAQRRVHRRSRSTLADAVGLGEDREGLAAGVEHRCAQLLAVQVGRLGLMPLFFSASTAAGVLL
jgi:hypothetical protein